MNRARDRAVARPIWSVLLLVLVALALFVTACGTEAEGDEAAGDATTTTMLVLPVQNDQCLACHTDFEERTADEQRAEFSHDLHLAQEIGCTDCHQQVGHEGAPSVPEGTCEDCHGLAMPHAAGYLQSHGADVTKAGGTAVCERCHNVYLHCQECHGLQMPHPDQWELKHGELAAPMMETCSNCHEPDFCLTCHPVEMPHPADWTRTHGLPVVEQGSAVCTTCHEPELCTACHGMPMPHPADWGTSHPAVAADKRGECLLCHDEADCTTCHEIHQTHGQGGAS